MKCELMKPLALVLTVVLLWSCKNENTDAVTEPERDTTPFVWEGANLYFLLTDRFNNGDPSNDVNFGRDKPTAVLRGFEGGDLKGITQKINEGYFNDLGINAIWMTPIVEQIHSGTDEGTGVTYPFHGYWTADWTAIDPNFGTADDLTELVAAAHKNGIRILLDAVINHTGPATPEDPAWPETWVRETPHCTYEDYASTITCTLVKNLPDILTGSDEPVDLPPRLVEKWKAEGRYDIEVAELDDFFERTGYPRAPRFYIMKWLTDYITDFGIDGYRVDTVRHVEENVWEEFRVECDYAFEQWKAANPDKVLDDNDFYLVGEVYGYGLTMGQYWQFSDCRAHYFNNSFDALINFELKADAAEMDIESMFAKTDSLLNSALAGYSTLHYMTSHDDAYPFDPERTKSLETATKLLLSPGASQTYYGDETARPLIIEGTEGDATLRSFMNWEDLATPETKAILEHWQKLGKFKKMHPALGAGRHQMVSESPYLFSRTYSKGELNDKVLVGLELPAGPKSLNVHNVFDEGAQVRDAYSGVETVVTEGSVQIDSQYDIVLLEELQK